MLCLRDSRCPVYPDFINLITQPFTEPFRVPVPCSQTLVFRVPCSNSAECHSVCWTFLISFHYPPVSNQYFSVLYYALGTFSDKSQRIDPLGDGWGPCTPIGSVSQQEWLTAILRHCLCEGGIEGGIFYLWPKVRAERGELGHDTPCRFLGDTSSQGKLEVMSS